ncbi:MAG TPA: nucleotidyltransferase domain-containing protein [Flammeovirgaceae bacterium]|nr:nucleotidyltransferase domain-containing protein [Flammeovirgaceae bacterium]
MIDEKDIIGKIRQAVKSVEPDATVILYGSYARGEQTSQSDLDILILLNRVKVSRKDEKRVKYPLYDIELETGRIISPLVLSRKDWESRHKITPFYEYVTKEGVEL